MPCPFGFASAAQEDAPAAEKKHESKGTCPFSSMIGSQGQDDAVQDDDRFDYNKDPISWFYQNQIKNEEDFQAKKAQLREEAKRRLEDIMARKNTKIAFELDEDDGLSIASSELSAWDSDVDSVSSLTSCADDWVRQHSFPAQAEGALKLACYTALAIVLNAMRVALVSYTSVQQFWGVLDYKWASLGIISLSLLALLCSGLAMQAWLRRSRRFLLAMQLTAHLMFTSALVLAVLAYTFPAQASSQIKVSACQQYPGSQAVSRMCELIPSIDLQLGASCAQVVQASALVALLGLALMLLGTWYQWELTHVEKRAIKHKRRYKRSKQTIPWDKIKIEGPMTFCGAGPAPAAAAAAAAAGEANGTKDKDL